MKQMISIEIVIWNHIILYKHLKPCNRLQIIKLYEVIIV